LEKIIMRASVVGVVAIALSTVFAVSSQTQGQLKEFGSKTITRIGVVVPDVAKAAKAYADVFGVPVSPAKDVKPSGFPAGYKGDPNAYTRVAEARFNNMVVELVQPMGGASPWREFLDTRGQGVHHVAFNVPGVESHVRFLESKGGKRVVGGPGGDAIVDLTAQIGINFALHEGQDTPSYIVKRRPEGKASGGPKVIARLGLLGEDTDSRRKVFNDIFGLSVGEPVNETGLTFPKGFTGDPESGMRHIFVPFDNMWINVIQPIGGESPWRNMVKNHQHYLFFGVEDSPAFAASLEAHGAKRVLGEAGGGVAYMDMQEQLGLTVFLLPAGVLPE